MTTGKSTSLIMVARQNKIRTKIHLKLKTDILVINYMVLKVKVKRMVVTFSMIRLFFLII